MAVALIRLSRDLFVLGIVCILLLNAEAVQAQSLAEARTLFERGNRELQLSQSQRGARKKASLQRALDAYVESLRIARNRNVIFNTAVALEGLSRDTDAFNYYQEFIQFEDLEERKRALAEQQLKSLTKRVGVVRIETNPVGAEVRVHRTDTPSLGLTPLSIAVDPKTRTKIHVSKKGYDSHEETVEIKTGQNTDLKLELTVQPVPLTVHAPGMLVEIDGNRAEEGKAHLLSPGTHELRINMGRVERTVEIQPGEPVTVDLRGTSVGSAPAHLSLESPVPVRAELDGALVAQDKTSFQLETEAGQHRLRVQAAGLAPDEATFSLDPGESQLVTLREQDVELDESTLGPWPTVFWIATGVTVAGAAALQVNYWLNYQDNQDDPGNPDTFKSADDARFVANIGLGVAAATGVTALVLTLLDEPVVERRLSIGIAPVPDGGAMITTEIRP